METCVIREKTQQQERVAFNGFGRGICTQPPNVDV